MAKLMFMDAGPVISLVMSRLVWTLPELKKRYGGKFYITPAVRRELVDRPLSVKRFQFEAMQVMKLIREGVLELYDDVPKGILDELNRLANNSFSIRGRPMDIIQSGELESVACALKTGADAVVVDERTLRLFIENNDEMKKLLEHRFQKPVQVNNDNMQSFSRKLKGITILRSVELAAAAFSLGLLDAYIPETKEMNWAEGMQAAAKETGKKETGSSMLLDSVLWALKSNGCAVTEHEIEEIKKYLLKWKRLKR